MRDALISQLTNHQPLDAEEARMTAQTLSFVEAHPDCFERSLLIGHVTGSAWIVSPDRQQVALIHHRKLDRWFQPGGHCDGDPNVLGVAIRETEEETGLAPLRVVSPAIFDVDIHTIPARGAVPEHLHYDIRYELEADPAQPFVHNEETKDIRWVAIDAVESLTSERSVLRMVEKTAKP